MIIIENILLEYVRIRVKERGKLDKSWFLERDRLMTAFLNNIIPALMKSISSTSHPVFNKDKGSEGFGEAG
jgi:hypothetical protein